MTISTNLLVMTAGLLCGIALGSLLRGLWLSRRADQAQSGAWGNASRLNRRLSFPPLHYRRRGRRWAIISLFLALSAYLSACVLHGSILSPSIEVLSAAGFWAGLGLLSRLFPLVLGMPAMVASVAIFLLFALGPRKVWRELPSQAEVLNTLTIGPTSATIIQRDYRQRWLKVHPIYAFFGAEIYIEQNPRVLIDQISRSCLEWIELLPGNQGGWCILPDYPPLPAIGTTIRLYFGPGIIQYWKLAQ